MSSAARKPKPTRVIGSKTLQAEARALGQALSKDERQRLLVAVVLSALAKDPHTKIGDDTMAAVSAYAERHGLQDTNELIAHVAATPPALVASVVELLRAHLATSPSEGVEGAARLLAQNLGLANFADRKAPPQGSIKAGPLAFFKMTTDDPNSPNRRK